MHLLYLGAGAQECHRLQAARTAAQKADAAGDSCHPDARPGAWRSTGHRRQFKRRRWEGGVYRQQSLGLHPRRRRLHDKAGTRADKRQIGELKHEVSDDEEPSEQSWPFAEDLPRISLLSSAHKRPKEEFIAQLPGRSVADRLLMYFFNEFDLASRE